MSSAFFSQGLSQLHQDGKDGILKFFLLLTNRLLSVQTDLSPRFHSGNK